MVLRGLMIAIMLLSNIPAQGNPIPCSSSEEEAHDGHANQPSPAGCPSQPTASNGLGMTCSACGGTVLMEQVSLPPVTALASLVDHQPTVFTVFTDSLWHPPA